MRRPLKLCARPLRLYARRLKLCTRRPHEFRARRPSILMRLASDAVGRSSYKGAPANRIKSSAIGQREVQPSPASRSCSVALGAFDVDVGFPSGEAASLCRPTFGSPMLGPNDSAFPSRQSVPPGRPELRASTPSASAPTLPRAPDASASARPTFAAEASLGNGRRPVV